MNSRNTTFGCLAAIAVAGICATAHAVGPITWSYTPGIWIADLKVAAPGKLSTPYTFEYFRHGAWHTRYSGTTDAAGNDDTWLWDTAGGITNPNKGTPIRVRFANGTTSNRTVAANLADTNNPLVQTVMAGTASTITGVGIEIRQNATSMLGSQGPAWYLAGNDLTLTLPTGFTWASLPTVTALGSGLGLGAVTLGNSNNSLNISVMSNSRIDSLAGVSISNGTVMYDGSGVAGEVKSMWHGFFEVEGASSFNEGLGELTQFEIIPTPGSCTLAFAGALVAVRRRR